MVPVTQIGAVTNDGRRAAPTSWPEGECKCSFLGAEMPFNVRGGPFHLMIGRQSESMVRYPDRWSPR